MNTHNSKNPRNRRRLANASAARSRMIGVWVTPEEYDELTRRAAHNGWTRPRLLLERGLADDSGATVTDLANLQHSVNQLTTQINKVGTNLNQIAHATNAAGTVPTGLEHALAEGILEYRHLMMKAKRIYEADES